MQGLATNFWPTARHYAEAVQCPAICFEEPALKRMLPAVDRLGMPLVTSGQFAYVFKLNAAGGAGEPVAVRCFRGYLGDRGARYRALDEHLNSHRVAALPRFKYLPKGILVAGVRFPVLVMEWVGGPTLDVYLDEAVGRREVLLHLAAEWVRLVASLREAGVAHGDLQHGNIIVERGRLRLVDLDGMYVPALGGFRASEVGHQHYQHPARDTADFSPDTDNFSALVIYLSLFALAERPELWREHHDENLLFTRDDFKDPDSSVLFAKIEGMGGEHARLARALKESAKSDPASAPRLLDMVSVGSKLPGWMTAPADIELSGRTREVARGSTLRPDAAAAWPRRTQRGVPATPSSASVQSIFNAAAPAPTQRRAPLDPNNIRGNALMFARNLFGNSYGYIWWIPLHNFLLGYLWAGFGITGAPGMLLSLFVIFALFMFYGLFRAVYEAETATGVGRRAVAPQSHAAPLAFTHAGGPTLFPVSQPAPPDANAVAVVGNRSLDIYHLPTCHWADKIAGRQRIDFDSPADAQTAGYRACHVCAP